MTIKLLSMSDTIKSRSFITPWTFIHFLNGSLGYLYLKHILQISKINSFIILFVLHTIYEIKDLEYYYNKNKNKNKNIENDYYGNNSIINSVGDTIFFIIGFLIAAQIKKVNNCDILIFIFINIILAYLFYSNKLG